jgi:hypothetical protein
MSANAHNLILRWAAARKERDAAKKRRAETLCKEHGRLLSEAGLDSDKIVLAYEERDTPASREAHNHYRTAAAGAQLFFALFLCREIPAPIAAILHSRHLRGQPATLPPQRGQGNAGRMAGGGGAWWV